MFVKRYYQGQTRNEKMDVADIIWIPFASPDHRRLSLKLKFYIFDDCLVWQKLFKRIQYYFWNSNTYYISEFQIPELIMYFQFPQIFSIYFATNVINNNNIRFLKHNRFYNYVFLIEKTLYDDESNFWNTRNKFHSLAMWSHVLMQYEAFSTSGPYHENYMCISHRNKLVTYVGFKPGIKI